MKKIICLIIALTCVFTLFSCKDKETPLDAYVKVVNASAPTRITTHTYVVYGEEEPLSGRFVTTVDGANSTLEYEYQRNAIPGVDNSAEPILTVSGVVYYNDGKYSEDGETWTTATPDASAMQVSFVLDSKKLSGATLVGNDLYITLTAEDAKAMLGLEFENVSDAGISLTVKTNGVMLTAVNISYTKVVDGVTSAVTVDTSYTYSPIVTDGGEEGDGSDNSGAED